MKSWNPALAGCALAMAMVFTNPVDAQWEGGRGPRERPSAEEIEKRRQEARKEVEVSLTDVYKLPGVSHHRKKAQKKRRRR